MRLACESIENVISVPSKSFDPAPKVDSVVLKFIPRKNRNFQKEKQILDFINICFKHPRKTLAFNLKSANIFNEKILAKIRDLGYTDAVRAEAISIEDWEKIVEIM